MRVTVVGAGIIGLSAAHALRHDGHEVRLVARELPAETTSAQAGASFKPRAVAASRPLPGLLRSSRHLLDAWEASGFAAELGIRRDWHVEASVAPVLVEGRDDLELMDDVRHLRAADGDAIPGGYAHAVAYRTFLFDVPVTMAALTAHLEEHGVRPARAAVDALTGPDVTDGADAVVDATGLGARELAGDDEVVAVRGQTVIVAADAGIPEVSVSADGIYCYPRRDGLLLGGTTELDVWETTPDPGAVSLILRANARLVPALLTAAPIAARSGLRPYRRTGVRLEVERAAPVPIVHAYGHGGAGWTLATGTAAWVATAVRRLARGG